MSDHLLSFHAEDRLVEMKLTIEQVELVLNDPEVTYPATRKGRNGRWHRGGRTVYARGDVAVLVHNETGDIITILWRTTEDYVRPDDGG